MPNGDVRRFVRFCCVGLTVFVIDFSLIRVFLFVFPPLASVSISYLLAVLSHFFLSKLWVFEASQPVSRGEVSGYLVVVAASWACTAGVVWMSLHLLSDNVYLAKALAIPPATLVSFVLMKRLAFRPVSAGSEPESQPAALPIQKS